MTYRVAMQALQLGCRPVSAARWSALQGSIFAAARVLSRRFATATAAEPDAASGSALLMESRSDVEAVADTPKEPRRHLVVTLLQYVYSTNACTSGAHLALPQGTHNVQRVKRIMNVNTTEDLMKALHGAKLETEGECVRYINLVGAYIRHQHLLQMQEDSTSPAARKRAAKVRKVEEVFYLTPEEQHALLRSACLLVEQRRVPLIVASRLLQLRWPKELRRNGGSFTQRYVAEIVRSWISEELREGKLIPSDARALLGNCAFAFKSQVEQSRTSRYGDASSPVSQDTNMESTLSSFIGSLATIAVKDITTPAQAEGLISVMWDVHATGCAAPPSFWDEMVQRVVQFNAALDTQLAEPEEASCAVGDSKKPKRRESPLSRQAGHFFTTLTTRQLYRFLLVLKLSKWSGDTTVLHQLADQVLRNVAFELEVTRHNGNAEDKDKDITQNKGTSVSEADLATPTKSFSPPFSTLVSHAALGAPHQADRPLSKRDIARRIRRIADMRPQEFLELLSLAADLRVPFGVSATRVSEELLSPLVPHLSTRDLLTLLQIVRRTKSQSTELLQAVMRRLMESGPAAPYTLTLSKTLIRTAATAPELFASMDMDDFVHFFIDVCEAQFSLCRPAVVVALGDLLYTLGRRYDEASVPGQRIRAVLNLFCAHMNRLLQLQVISTALVEPLLEFTVLLRMRQHHERYPAVHELLHTRIIVEEQKQARQAAFQESTAGHIDASGISPGKEGNGKQLAAEAAGSEPIAGHAPRWEDRPEAELPKISKAALHVYEEICYMFERMVVIKAKLNKNDFSIFEHDLGKAGLYSLLQGVQLFHHGHLGTEVAYTTDTAREAASQIPRVLPRWMEKAINAIILRKVDRSCFREESTDNEVLKPLGHVHCDAAKVDAVVALIVESPLQMAKRKRALWLYVRELAQRFGSDDTKKSIATYLSKSLF
ncbi:putative mitochondrial RNA binding protein [Leptomonas seymouri]|uniref:Putative mitochondrial RNA binding protein n=1 Tax=Leptomonas seymouri TaxID=5684 RepID=A0A0N0P952_LEPSE|nr:putative mitochondrial RNA binding protein [Leptomonas seymouri]|eukprot:KPI90297.1 putative mitochondrial RNA binding protein [Leptomonas seymouri]